jgi:hypothetical protein
MITKEGGIVKKTNEFLAAENVQDLKATITIREDQSIGGSLSQVSKGVLYSDKYELDTKESDITQKYYKNSWSYLNNLDISQVSFENDKTAVVFTENVSFEAASYTSKAGERLLLAPNIFNRIDYISTPKKEREQSLVILRAKNYQDAIELTLPDGYAIESAFEPIEISTEFGSYKAKVESIGASKITYTRSFSISEGTYSKEKYGDFVLFINAITKADNSKIVLAKK